MGDDTWPVWQKLYQIVSGSNKNVIPEILDEVLGICEERMVNVLLEFKVYTKGSFERWKKEAAPPLVSRDDEMCLFVHRMSKELDLDVSLAWSVICNFLIFGYYGKVTELKSIISYEANITSLIEHLWMFYTSDRMFLLKTLRFIFEKLNDKDYIYHEQFCAIFEEVDMKEVWKNTIKTFEYLLEEIDSEKSSRVSERILKKWLKRNNREQVEVLLLMIQLVSFIELRLDGDELSQVLHMFLKHGLGRHPLFFGAGSLPPNCLVDIKNAEIGVVLALLQRFWLKPDIFKMLSNEMETDLELMQLQDDHRTVLFIWVIFKASLSPDNFENCSRAMEVLLPRGVFKSLAECVTSNMFQDCEAGVAVKVATNSLFKELVKFVPDHRFLYQQEGVVEIICELYKNSKLHALENLGMFLRIALDMFPWKFENLINLAKAILVGEENYFKVLRVLENCPSFCTDLEWCYTSDAVIQTGPNILLFGAEDFVIPAGTLSERCNCFGADFIKFNYNFNFFIIMDQYIRALTQTAMQKGLLNVGILRYVLGGVRFITFILKNYRGDLKRDPLIYPVLRRLDCVPTFFSNSCFSNYELFYVYFEAVTAQFMYHDVEFDDVFSSTVQKFMFPTVTDYKSRFLEITQESILYGFLKKEEEMKDHKLLLEFIDFIIYFLKKDEYHEEVIHAGVWYLLYTVFPNHKRWDCQEADEFQQIKILNGCLRVFVEVLQRKDDLPQFPGQRNIYLLVLNGFIDDPFIIDTFHNIFVKNKFFLPDWMHQETNWIAGKTLIVQETVKLELLVLLLIFKCRAKVEKPMCVIDGATHTFAKAASVYFITPYNNTLSVLAGKFLNMLGKNENLPLMSCLEVDYDQTQTFFLERLRDPLEDEEVKLSILQLISTCILHQTGMTAAFFNIQATKRWYNPDVKRLVGDTVGDFMLDYLKNIKKSVAYLQSPLQVGILNVMANLWQSEKQHLINNITSSKDFWFLVIDPLLKGFQQKPLVYTYLFRILAIQFATALRNPEGQEEFFLAIKRFLNDDVQLNLFQNYLARIFLNKDLDKESLEERGDLLQVFSELLVISQKKTKFVTFPDEECKYYYIELAFEGLQNKVVHDNLLSEWLDFMLVIIDMFGLNFKQHMRSITKNVVEFTRIIKLNYEYCMSIRDRQTSLGCLLKVMTHLKGYYKDNPEELIEFLEEVGPLIDFEYDFLEDISNKFLEDDPLAKEYLGPWALLISIGNCVLSYKDCDAYAIWFSNRKFLSKLVESSIQLLVHKKSRQAGQIALHGVNLYIQSSLAFDFFNVNLLKFFDRVEPVVSSLINGTLTKVDVLDLKEAWVIFNLLVKFNLTFLRKFHKNAVEICHGFVTLNQRTLTHVMSLAENTVDFKALDLLAQTLMFFHEILRNWKAEWRINSNKVFIEMTEGIRKSINACIYLCLRPKHIQFYCLDNYYRLVLIDQGTTSMNDLMISVINRLLGILGLAFSCLYELNHSLIQLLNNPEPGETHLILIENDFSVPRFELPIPKELTYGKLLCLAHFLCKALNQLQQRNDDNEEPLKVDDTLYDQHIGLVEHQDPSDFKPDQKLSSFLRYLHEYSGMIDPWINNLNYKNTRRTADSLMLFIAQQAFLSLKVLDKVHAAYYKRNLYSELQFFHEYIKKRTSELAAAIPSSPGYSGDMDYVKRYLLYHWKKDDKGNTKIDKVAEENFLLIISFWLSNICQIQ